MFNKTVHGICCQHIGKCYLDTCSCQRQQLLLPQPLAQTWGPRPQWLQGQHPQRVPSPQEHSAMHHQHPGFDKGILRFKLVENIYTQTAWKQGPPNDLPPSGVSSHHAHHHAGNHPLRLVVPLLLHGQGYPV